MRQAQKTLADFLTGGNASFKELPDELVMKALEGQTDQISPAARVQEAFLRQVTCPNCRGSSFTRQFLGMSSGGRNVTWVEGDVLPRPILVCNACEITFNPYSGIIIEQPPQHIIPMDE